MTVRKLFTPQASADWKQAQQTYGTGYTVESDQWLDDVKTDAVSREFHLSVDFHEIANQLESEAVIDQVSHSIFPSLGDRLKDMSFIQKLRLVKTLILSKRIPWSCRVAVREFKVVGGTEPSVVFAFFEIDCSKKHILFRKFCGLPGQELPHDE
jgi:hypothetical protein